PPRYCEPCGHPALQPLAWQASLQIDKVVQKVQHPAGACRRNVLTPRQSLQPCSGWDTNKRTPHQTQEGPGVSSIWGTEHTQDSFDRPEAFPPEPVHQVGITLEIVQGHHRCLRQAVLGKGPRCSMVNVRRTIEVC